MGLILRIIRFEEGVVPPEMEYQWNEMGGTIGRNSTNDWVLPDAKRFLSGRHATIKASNGDYYLTDTSTNGVFINRKATPLGRDNSVRIEHGDVLRMGAYEIEVILEQRQNSPAGTAETMPPAMPFAAFDESEDEPVSAPAIADDKTGQRPVTDKNAVQGFEFPVAETDDEPPLLADWDDDGARRENVASHIPDPFFVDDEFKAGDSEQIPADFGTRQATDDPFAGLSDFFAPPAIDAVRSGQSEPKQEAPDATGERVSEEPPAGDAAAKKGKALPEIPDDFWATADDEALDDPFAQKNTAKANVAKPDFAKPSVAEEYNAPQREAVQQQSERKSEQNQQHRQFRKVAGKAIPSPSTTSVKPRSAAVDKAATGSERSREARSSVEEEASTLSREQALADFLRGFGVSDTAKQQTIARHLQLDTVGVLFRILLQGCMEVLRSRASIKSEMRMDVTTIQPIQNNPVKFSIDVDDALLKLLVPQGQSYMPPEQALAEAFDDIKAHQVAVIAGVQSSLKHVLKRFEPEKLVERLEKQGSVIDKIPIQREAKLWQLFEGLYSTIEAEAGDDFQRLFGLEFSRAYEAQIAKLEAMRNVE